MEIAALNSTLSYENFPELLLASYNPNLSPRLGFCSKTSPYFKYQNISLALIKNLPSKHTEVFERKIQPHEMVKYLCKSIVVCNCKFANCLT